MRVDLFVKMNYRNSAGDGSYILWNGGWACSGRDECRLMFHDECW